MKSFELSIYASDKLFYQGLCESLVVPLAFGQYGILAAHRNLIAPVEPGILSYRAPGGEKLYASVSNGLLKIENGNVLLLVYTCERPEEIDVKRAEQAREEARRKLKEKLSNQEYELVRSRLARALNRLKASEKRVF